MDWSKAKTILIIAFIVTDLILIYVIFDFHSIDEPTLKGNFIDDAVKLLNEKDIKVDCEIPKELPLLPMMTVEYEKWDSTLLNNEFFQGKGDIQIQGDKIVQCNRGLETVTLVDDKNIIYENKDDKAKYSHITKEEAIDLAKRFLIDRGMKADDIKLSYYKESEDIHYIYFTKVYKNVYVEKAYTKFEIDERGVKKFERLWLNTVSMGGTKISIDTAPKAILKLLSMPETYGKVIEDISLCYYFDPQRNMDIENPKNTKQGKTSPAWRVQFDDGLVVYLDEY